MAQAHCLVRGFTKFFSFLYKVLKVSLLSLIVCVVWSAIQNKTTYPTNDLVSNKHNKRQQHNESTGCFDLVEVAAGVRSDSACDPESYPVSPEVVDSFLRPIAPDADADGCGHQAFQAMFGDDARRTYCGIVDRWKPVSSKCMPAFTGADELPKEVQYPIAACGALCRSTSTQRQRRFQSALFAAFAKIVHTVSPSGQAAKVADADPVFVVEGFPTLEPVAAAPIKTMFVRLVTAAGRHGRHREAQMFLVLSSVTQVAMLTRWQCGKGKCTHHICFAFTVVIYNLHMLLIYIYIYICVCLCV